MKKQTVKIKIKRRPDGSRSVRCKGDIAPAELTRIFTDIERHPRKYEHTSFYKAVVSAIKATKFTIRHSLSFARRLGHIGKAIREASSREFSKVDINRHQYKEIYRETH